MDADDARGFAGRPLSAAEVGAEVPLPEPEPRRYHSEVVVERLGGVSMPVDVQVAFDDGTTVTEHWDGRDRWRRFEYAGAQRVEWAVVDPNATMPLDIDNLNNSRLRVASTRGPVCLTSRWGFWFQNLLYFLWAL